jgi:uncharacterized protein YdhG (YjbR/CyaY superfamily)
MGERNDEITGYIAKYETAKKERLETIRIMIHESITGIHEKLWTKVPCFYTDKTKIVIRVFDDHINLAADSVIQYKDELMEYVITPKGMLQIFDDQELPSVTLRKIFYACER